MSKLGLPNEDRDALLAYIEADGDENAKRAVDTCRLVTVDFGEDRDLTAAYDAVFDAQITLSRARHACAKTLVRRWEGVLAREIERREAERVIGWLAAILDGIGVTNHDCASCGVNLTARAWYRELVVSHSVSVSNHYCVDCWYKRPARKPDATYEIPVGIGVPVPDGWLYVGLVRAAGNELRNDPPTDQCAAGLALYDRYQEARRAR